VQDVNGKPIPAGVATFSLVSGQQPGFLAATHNKSDEEGDMELSSHLSAEAMAGSFLPTWLAALWHLLPLPPCPNLQMP
jgi:hypothetical protein